MTRRSRSTGPAAPTYGVFVQFRSHRLTLKRGFQTAEDAAAFAAQVKKLRFHDPESVFLLREPDLVPVSATGLPLETVSLGDARARPLLDGMPLPLDAAEPEPPPASLPSAVAEAVATYAKALAAALEVLGPSPREKVLGMLHALNLPLADAEAVLAYALARALLTTDPGDPERLRVGSG